MTDTANGGPKGRRGLASMSPEKVREIASMGGRAAHEKGTAHEWTSEEARRVGRLGGIAKRNRSDGRRQTPPHPDTPVSPVVK